MNQVLNCITTEHDPLLLLLAAAICTLGSILTMRLFARVRNSENDCRIYWMLLTGLLSGGTIWSTHFIAMLGYQGIGQNSYEPVLTALSLFVGFGFATVGLYISALGRNDMRIELGGAILGLGIAAMHFTGMAAYRFAGHFVWDGDVVTASILFGAVFGAVATNRVARPVSRFCKYGGALALVLATVSMHFTAMGALTPVPDPTVAPPEMLIPDSYLAIVVVLIISVVMAAGAAAYMIDVHTNAEATDRYKQMALHDPMTGLPNRTHLFSRLDRDIHARNESATRTAVVAFNLNNFRIVNDLHGHAYGDDLLRHFASRLSETLSGNEFLARVGGDEFVVIRTDLISQRDVKAYAAELYERAKAQLPKDDKAETIGLRAGLCLYPDDAETVEELVKGADVAAGWAKYGRDDGICRFERDMDIEKRERVRLASDLRHSIERDELELHYQRQNDTETREIVGFEVLVRWRHPDRGMVSPAEFIPIAEETGFIVELGEWVLKQACAEAASWPVPYRIAVNVAPSQLTQPDLADMIHETLVETGLPASRLEIEITESGIIADQQHALHLMRRMKQYGIKIAMDDYGTGYSSLSTLKNYPFDKIKIDREFVDAVNTDEHSAAIVKATILLGASLDIPVLAEGVETEEQMAFLERAGCSQVQGFFFGKPMPLDELRNVILTAAAEKHGSRVSDFSLARARSRGSAVA